MHTTRAMEREPSSSGGRGGNPGTLSNIMNYRTSNGFPVVAALFPLLIFLAATGCFRKQVRASYPLAVCGGVCVAFVACALLVMIMFAGP